MESIAFSLVEGFAGTNGMFDLVKRSGTLEGSLPLRAVQFCPPVGEGSAAGAQVMARDRFEIRRTKRGLDVRLSATGRRLMAETHGLLALCVGRGLLARHGHWHRRFSDGPLVLAGERLQVWTGLLVRPQDGNWLVLTGAYNRRSRLEIVPHVIASERPVPVVLDIDLRPLATRKGLAELDAEVGCLLPVRPRMRMELRSLEHELEVARSVAEFFDRSYFVQKKKKPTAKYRSLISKASAPSGSQAQISRLVYLGPAIHSVRRFARFAGTRGFSRTPETPGQLEYGVVRSAGAIDATWDGQYFTTRPSDGLQRQVDRFERLLRRHLPETDFRSAAASFGLVPRARRDEPYMLLTPAVFCVTPPGWSSVLDGVHHPPVDGMRGVISTDLFHPLPMVFRSYGPADVHWPVRAPILRALPVERAMLAAAWDVRPWTDIPQESSS
jgi:hypothetical protein